MDDPMSRSAVDVKFEREGNSDRVRTCMLASTHYSNKRTGELASKSPAPDTLYGMF